MPLDVPDVEHDEIIELMYRDKKVERGKLRSSPLAPRVVATVHPSSILRAPDDATRRADMAAFVRDLKVARRLLG